ncbi:MAG: CarD family transcriptional regulator [Clostridiales bacterium]|nr:CarD family transcriptional regulator [Clostridiales bacterium]
MAEDVFEKRQLIYSETQGICRVENIVTLSAKRGEPGVPYYVLRPIFDREQVSYIPVENHQVALRKLFSREEAKELLDSGTADNDENLRNAVSYVLGDSVSPRRLGNS